MDRTDRLIIATIVILLVSLGLSIGESNKNNPVEIRCTK